MKKNNWEKIWEREYTLNRLEMVCLSLNTPFTKKIMGFTVPEVGLVRMKNGNIAFCAKAYGWQRFKKFIQSLFSRPASFSRFVRLYDQTKQQLLQKAKETDKCTQEKLTRDGLAKTYLGFIEADLRFMLAGQWWAFYLAEKADQVAQDLAAKKFKSFSQQQNFISAILSPAKKSYIRNERIHLLNIVLEKNKIKKQKMLEEHIRLFEWIPCINVFNPPPWSRAFFEKQIKKITRSQATRELREMKQYYKNVSPKFNAALKTLTAKERELARQCQIAAFLKDDRDDVRRYAYFKTRSLFIQIAKTLRIAKNDLLYFSQQEIRNALQNEGRLDRSELAKRKLGFAAMYEHGKFKVYTGKAYSQWMKKISSYTDKDTELKGTVASPGLVRGRTRIISSAFQLSKMKKGDILVTVVTHPDYLPAMRIAKAIVTDEGGLTSHAAIVSRELGIPCIVGTKNATQILKDGDMVEVDAINGMVKKL